MSQLAGEDGTFIDLALVPPTPLCRTCAEAQFRALLGPDGWARREKVIAAMREFFAALPEGLTAEERFARYSAHVRAQSLAEGEGKAG